MDWCVIEHIHQSEGTIFYCRLALIPLNKLGFEKFVLDSFHFLYFVFRQESSSANTLPKLITTEIRFYEKVLVHHFLLFLRYRFKIKNKESKNIYVRIEHTYDTILQIWDWKINCFNKNNLRGVVVLSQYRRKTKNESLISCQETNISTYSILVCVLHFWVFTFYQLSHICKSPSFKK